MKKVLKLFFRIPFILLNKIKYKNKSLLWRVSQDVFSISDKIQLSKAFNFKAIIDKEPHRGFKIIVFLNTLILETNLAKRFATNLIENLHLFESQLGQDCIVDTLFQGKRNGFFVEIGVGEGKKISNTFFLEKYRDWSGILCEPSVKFHSSIRSTRSAKLITEAIFNKTGLELDFVEVEGDEELSTLSDFRHDDSHTRDNVTQYKVSSISFNDLYMRHFNQKKIDYLSIDTEGSELVILSAIDLDKIDISIISVEHNYNQDKVQEIASLLQKFNYVEILPGVFEFDIIFAKRGIVESFN